MKRTVLTAFCTLAVMLTASLVGCGDTGASSLPALPQMDNDYPDSLYQAPELPDDTEQLRQLYRELLTLPDNTVQLLIEDGLDEATVRKMDRLDLQDYNDNLPMYSYDPGGITVKEYAAQRSEEFARENAPTPEQRAFFERLKIPDDYMYRLVAKFGYDSLINEMSEEDVLHQYKLYYYADRAYEEYQEFLRELKSRYEALAN